MSNHFVLDICSAGITRYRLARNTRKDPRTTSRTTTLKSEKKTSKISAPIVLWTIIREFEAIKTRAERYFGDRLMKITRLLMYWLQCIALMTISFLAQLKCKLFGAPKPSRPTRCSLGIPYTYANRHWLDYRWDEQSKTFVHEPWRELKYYPQPLPIEMEERDGQFFMRSGYSEMFYVPEKESEDTST